MLLQLDYDEAVRARIFHDALAGEHVPHVTPYELIETAKGKNYMIMPKFATTLEPLPFLSSDGVAMLWAHVQEALEGLHARGFAHADVKPAKICLTEDGGSVFLIDLGSMARMGERTSSTAPYVPLDVPRGRASAALDWWMLAMTLAEKACGSGQGLEVGGTSHATMNELRTHLASHLSPAVWAALEPKLVE